MTPPAGTPPGTPTAPVDRDGPPLAWREAGDGPVVLFLHGLGGSRTAWDPQLTGLADRFRCVAWDLPGYGRSLPLPVLTFPAIADAVARLLDRLGVDRAHLVGESFGGMHALHTALAHPDRVDRLVLTNTSPAFGLDGTRPDDWKRARLAPLDAGATTADIARQVLTAIAGPGLVGPALEARVAAFGRIPAGALRAAVTCLPDHDVRSRLRSITAPALVIAGELDAETPVGYAGVLADGLAHASLVVLDGIGHLAASEDPERFNRLVGPFLEGADEPGEAARAQEPQSRMTG